MLPVRLNVVAVPGYDVVWVVESGNTTFPVLSNVQILLPLSETISKIVPNQNSNCWNCTESK